MRSIRIEFGPDAISDVQLAVALLRGAASNAEAAIASSAGPGRASTHWEPEALAAAGPLRKIIASCLAFEAAITAPPHMPSPETLATIARVEAARVSMPSAATLAAIALVEATRRPKG
jgi:hypothetical protein